MFIPSEIALYASTYPDPVHNFIASQKSIQSASLYYVISYKGLNADLKPYSNQEDILSEMSGFFDFLQNRWKIKKYPYDVKSGILPLGTEPYTEVCNGSNTVFYRPDYEEDIKVSHYTGPSQLNPPYMFFPYQFLIPETYNASLEKTEDNSWNLIYEFQYTDYTEKDLHAGSGNNIDLNEWKRKKRKLTFTINFDGYLLRVLYEHVHNDRLNKRILLEAKEWLNYNGSYFPTQYDYTLYFDQENIKYLFPDFPMKKTTDNDHIEYKHFRWEIKEIDFNPKLTENHYNPDIPDQVQIFDFERIGRKYTRTPDGSFIPETATEVINNDIDKIKETQLTSDRNVLYRIVAAGILLSILFLFFVRKLYR